MSWSFFVLHKCQLHNSLWHANQIRWGHGRSPILLSLALLPNPQEWNIPTHIATCMHLIIKSSFKLWCNRLTPSLNVHLAGLHTCTLQHHIYIFLCLEMTLATKTPWILKINSSRVTICIGVFERSFEKTSFSSFKLFWMLEGIHKMLFDGENIRGIIKC